MRACMDPLPVNNSPPVDQTVNAGQSVSFSVSASGTNLAYQWLKNGVAISGATSSTFTIASPQTGDQAAYVVRISGTGGTVDSSMATLTVIPPGSGPITTRPVSQA